MLSDYAPYVIGGLVTGSMFGLAATGLVLTYKTSGVLNFAHGAIGAGAAYLFYDLRSSHVPAVVAAVLVVGLFAPTFGLVMSGLAARLANTSAAKRVVATVGILITFQGLLTIRYGATPRQVTAALPSSTFRVAGVYVGWDQIVTIVIAIALVAALEVLFARTRFGKQMRAVVDSPTLLDLTGESPHGVSARAWAMGSMFAATSGILLAPAVGLDAGVLTLVVVQAFGAAALGRFESVALTFAGGVAIGLVQNLINAPSVQKGLPFLADLPGIDQTIPFFVLFGVLVFTRRGRLREVTIQRAPRPVTKAPWPLALAGSMAALAFGLLLPDISPTRLPVFTIGAVFIVISASLFLLVEVSNQVSLCHVAFVAIGGTTFAHFTTGQGLPWFVGALLAALVLLPVGALVAVPAMRLSGAFLGLATLAFGILVEKVLYARQIMFGRFGQVTGQRPHALGLDSDRGYYYLCLLAGVAAIGLVALIRRSRLGRLLTGMADSPVGLTTLGLNLAVTRVLVFAISAALAGLAGALDVGISGTISSVGTSPGALVSFNSLLWLAVLAFVGRRTAVSPVVAAFLLVVGPSFNTNADTVSYLTVGFGIAAVFVATFGPGADRWLGLRASLDAPRIRSTPGRDRTRQAGVPRIRATDARITT